MLRKYSKQADNVYLAMDPDREGEAIAWHLKYLLGVGYKNRNKHLKFLRSTFNEITQKAVLKAIENPGKINMDLVDAQQARRVLDRLVGYGVSPVLWKKIRRGLSAGRVQSVALRLIVEKEREIEAFKPDEYWEIGVALNTKEKSLVKRDYFKEGKVVEDLPKQVLVVALDKVENKKFGKPPFAEKQAKPIIDDLKKADYKVADVIKKERTRASLPPFTTSLLQQNAATKFGFSSKQTMRLAQQLYEEGLITYHRTDSFNLSASSIKMARDYVAETFGEEYLPESSRIFKSKSKNAQEAHEAIRVTHVNITKEQVPAQDNKFTAQHAKLYDLIWRRFVASQMNPAIYDQTTIEVEAEGKKNYLLKVTGSIMKFAGWTKLFANDNDVLLPDVEAGQDLGYLDINPVQKYTQPPARYNDASLVKELEKKGIGRPSTYASIISVIQDRGYVEKEEKRFFATAVGKTVSDFLLKNFEEFMDYDFTAEMEEDLDRISRGEKEWVTVIRTLWKPFSSKIDKVTDEAKRVQIPVEKTGEECPDCGKEEKGEIVIRTGRFGKFKSCSRFPDCKYTQNIVEKLDGRKCPLCKEGEIIIKKTRWGKDFYGCGRYPDCDWASWKKPEPGLKVTKPQWAKMQAERKKRAAKRKATWEKNKKKSK
jgi:DNA topoisomerase I